jgi:hypothetical protein
VEIWVEVLGRIWTLYSWNGVRSVRRQSNTCLKAVNNLRSCLTLWNPYACARDRRPKHVTEFDNQVILI